MSLLPPTSTFAEQGGSSLCRGARARAGARAPWTVSSLDCGPSRAVPLQGGCTWAVARRRAHPLERPGGSGAALTPRVPSGSGRGDRGLEAAQHRRAAGWDTTMVSETGGLPVGSVCVIADRAIACALQRFEMVQEPAPRPRKLRGTVATHLGTSRLRAARRHGSPQPPPPPAPSAVVTATGSRPRCSPVRATARDGAHGRWRGCAAAARRCPHCEGTRVRLHLAAGRVQQEGRA
jgi:hypothetical protein